MGPLRVFVGLQTLEPPLPVKPETGSHTHRAGTGEEAGHSRLVGGRVSSKVTYRPGLAGAPWHEEISAPARKNLTGF